MEPPAQSNDVSTTSNGDDDTRFTPHQNIRYVSDPVQSVCGSFLFDSDSGLASLRNVAPGGGRWCIQESSEALVVREEVNWESLSDHEEEEEYLLQPRQSRSNLSRNQNQSIDSSGKSDTTGRTESLSESGEVIVREDDKAGKNGSLSDISDDEAFCEDEGVPDHCFLPQHSEQFLVNRDRPALDPPEEMKPDAPTESKAPAVKKRTDKVKNTPRQIKQQISVDPPSQRYKGYNHTFVTVLEEHRFLVLYTLLKRNTDVKIIIFFSTTKSAQYYSKLLERLKFDVVLGSCQSKSTFDSECLQQFSKRAAGILCLPNSRSKNLEVPLSATWLIQFEPPESPVEYIARIGRMSFEKSHAGGRALLFLTPQQYGFIRYYKAAKVKVKEYEIHGISNVQRELIKLMRKEGKLRKYGQDAYHAYKKSYASHDYRDIFNIHSLDLKKVALAFGFAQPPCKDDNDGKDESPGRRLIAREERRWKQNKTKKGSDCTNNEEKRRNYANRHAKRTSCSRSRIGNDISNSMR